MCVLCTRVCMCACVCVRACEYDEPFSYLISSYSSSRICSLGNRSHRSMFPFPLYRDIWTFRLFIQSVACRRRGRRNMASFVETEAKRTNVEREPGEKWIDRFFSPSFFFLSYFFLFVFLSYDFSRPGYHFLFRGGAEKTTNNEGQSDSCTVEGFKIEAGHRTVTRPESNSIRSPGIRFATRLLSARNERNPEFRSTRLFSFLSRVPRTRNGSEKRRCAPFAFDDLFYSFRFAFTIAFENDFIR